MSALSLRRYRVTLIEVTPLVVEIDAASKGDAIQAAFDLWSESGEEPFSVCEGAIKSSRAVAMPR